MKPLFATVAALVVLGTALSAQAYEPKATIADLDARLAKIGTARVEGTDTVAGKPVPALFFGERKINNNFDVVDAIRKTHSATATVFVKDGEEFDARQHQRARHPKASAASAPSWRATRPTRRSPRVSPIAVKSTCSARSSTPATTRSRTTRARSSA